MIDVIEVIEVATAGEPSSDEEIIEAFAGATPRSAWRILGRNQARVSYDLLREAEQARLTDEQRFEARLIRECLYRAITAACVRQHGFQRLMDWYSGSSIETTWSELHQAGERMLLVQPVAAVKNRIGDIDASLRSNLKEDDVRLAPATKRLAELAHDESPAIESARDELRSYQEWADKAGDEAHANVRSLRDLLIAVGGSVVVVLVVLGTLNWISSGFLNLTGTLTHGTPPPIGVWEIEAVAALGGMIAAVFTLAKLGGFGGPYRLPAYQALIRIPAGAAVGLAAVLLVQSGQVAALKAQHGLGVLSIALIFGYAPDVLLRFVDQRAASLLGQAQSKDNPAGPPASIPRAGSA